MCSDAHNITLRSTLF